MIKLIMFLLGFLCGMITLIVFSCMVISGQESRREEEENENLHL